MLKTRRMESRKRSTAQSSSRFVAITNRQYAVALSRAFAGALIFGLPLLLTMEMWWLGIYLEPHRLVVFTLANIVLLYFLSQVAGFEESHSRLDDLLDAFSAYFAATLTAAVALYLIGAFETDMAWVDVAGIIAIQAVPASFGAMIGAKLMGEGDAIERSERLRDTYPGQLFLMLAGALFLSFTVAPTEEVLLIAVRIGPVQTLGLLAGSIVLLHMILYVSGFRGQPGRRSTGGQGAALLRQTLPGYGLAVLAALFILWTFGRLEDAAPWLMATAAIVLAVPGAVGAAISRIVI